MIRLQSNCAKKAIFRRILIDVECKKSFVQVLFFRRKEGYMTNAIDLSRYGIVGATEIVHNPSYEQLFEEDQS